MELITANRVPNKTRQAHSPRPHWIIRGAYRTRFDCWAEIHAHCLQGWFFIRRGNELICHYGDIEEGRA